MKEAVTTGLNFGLTSGVITTLGLIVGLHAGTHSTLAVIGGIITIAIADSMSDALGIHISQEGGSDSNHHDVWIATFMTLLSKMGMATTFLVPVLVFDIQTAIIVSVVWGLTVITALSYWLAKKQGDNPFATVAEHLAIAITVIVLTHFIGDWVSVHFQ